MIIDGALESKLYTRESIELPSIIKDRLPRIQSVYQPESVHDIQKLFSRCQKGRVSLIPRGAATSGIGCIVPLKKSIMLDLTSLNKIVDFDKNEKTICIEAGIRWWDVKHFLKTHSLDLYTCPSSLFSTVGGWLATGGYGINSFRYGHLSNLVDSIEIVTPRKNRWVDRNDREFKYFLGTEGQMGIISKVKLKVRESRPSKSYLVFFNTPAEAVGFLSATLKSLQASPLHISYFDRYRIAHKNHYLNGKGAFPETEAVLLTFEDRPSEDEWVSLVQRKKGKLADEHLTAFVWNERYFPFSIRHFYPSILGCEILLPVQNLDRYISRTRNFGKDYGLSLSTEATLVNPDEAVVFTIFPSDPKKISHFVHLFLTYSLAHIALQSGGKPYGIGTWNLPLMKKLFSKKEKEEHRAYKEESDPQNLINPAKSFSPDSPFSSLMKAAYSTSRLFASGFPLLKPFLRIPGNGSPNGKHKLSAPEACANCGACIPVCPAYMMKKNELVTAKGKLFLMKHLLNGSSVPKSTAENVFYCLHCHLCEHVCQSKLILMPVWEKLESIVEKIHGRPEEKIKSFIEQMESHPATTQLLETFGIAPHSIHKETQNV
ncbi:MAG: FAD-binding protein [Candidatus Aminicenantes bacterium]|jgi:FAD/FMN-containing dehydrogenase/NAD-dependent dihydropyrimidine dehydrogenase PreA subunit